MTPTDAEYEQLLEIAYYALDERQFEDAGAIFDALALTRTDKPYPRIGQALRAYALGERDAAITGLQDVLTDFPEAVFTRSTLAQLLKEVGRPEWQRYAREVLDRVQSGVAADIARQLLGERYAVTSPTASTPPTSPAWMPMQRV